MLYAKCVIDTIVPVIFIYFLFAENGFLTEASSEKGAIKKNAVLKEQSSNQISVKGDEKAKAEEQLYYLPLQTVFGETHALSGPGSVSTTSPPHLSIDPAPIQTQHLTSTNIFYEDVKEYHNVASQCVSETPVIELESRFLFPSKDIVKESVIMSGHLEIASKTSSLEDVMEKRSIVSKPSIALQGTDFHAHTIADL